MEAISIVDYCAANPAAVSLTASAADGIQAMVNQGMGATAVVDENGIVAGIFTERDVLHNVALSGRDPHSIPIREVMSPAVLLATRETSIAEALQWMVEQHKRHLPVVEEDGKLIGVLSIRHVLERKVDELTRQLAESVRA